MSSSSKDIITATQFIHQGKLVVFPTETVYGIGADATNDAACQKIYEVKSRPSTNPLIIHVDNLEIAQMIGQFNTYALKLSTLWPGPISIVVPLNKSSDIKISTVATANLNSVAIRIPSNKITLALLQSVKKPIAAPSANPSGYISPTRFQHVTTHFQQHSNLLFFLEGEKAIYGLESTIVDTTTDIPTILRYGSVTPQMIKNIIGTMPIIAASNSAILKAPGMMLKHYSPITKIRLNASKLHHREVGLNYGDNILQGGYCLNLSSTANLVEAAANLYHMLRHLDDYAQSNKNDVDTIAIASIPNVGVGQAINDKLKRATAY